MKIFIRLNYRNLQYNLIKNYKNGSILEVKGDNREIIELFSIQIIDFNI